MSTKHEVAVELAGGKRLAFETGRMAKQASGAALVTTGETVVLATAVASPDPREGIDFFPLTVDYREYTYAGGRIPGGFIKREGRPSEKEILTARQIDRPIRPLFPDGFRNETQVIALCFPQIRKTILMWWPSTRQPLPWRSRIFRLAQRLARSAWGV